MDFLVNNQKIKVSKYVFNKNCIISQALFSRKMQLFHPRWRTLVTFLVAFCTVILLNSCTSNFPKKSESSAYVMKATSLALSSLANTFGLTIVRKWFLTMNETKFWRKMCHFKWRHLKNRRMNGFNIKIVVVVLHTFFYFPKYSETLKISLPYQPSRNFFIKSHFPTLCQLKLSFLERRSSSYLSGEVPLWRDQQS